LGNLLASLSTAAESLRSFERALSVTSNNVTNANTPGYVRQQVNLVAQPLQLDTGLPGGVRAQGLLSARDSYLEQSVRRQTQQSSGADERAALLKQVEPIFNISSGSGVASAFDAFHAAISQWTIGPNDSPARQNVIRAAGDVSHAFQTTAQSLQMAGQRTDTDITAAVSAVNRLGGVLSGLNAKIQSDARALQDPGVDAQINTALEDLSQYSDFTVLRADNGTYSVYLGNQTPLVLGGHEYSISADLSGPQPALRDSQGKDITSQIGDGKLKALIDFRTNFLPATVSDLNRLAGSFADQVNATLASGLDSNGQPPTQQLFTYSAANGTAATLSVTSITPDQLAAATPGAPGGNGNALTLDDTLSKRNIDNFTYSQFFGDLAGRVGRAISVASDDQQTQAGLLAQVQSVRESKSKVSLDQEAADLIQFQRAYEATAKIIQTLDQLTQDLINLKQP